MRQAFVEFFFLLVLSVIGCRADGFHGLLRNIRARNSNLPVHERGPPSGSDDNFLGATDLAKNDDIEDFWEDRLLASQSMANSPRTAAPFTSPSVRSNTPRNDKCTNAVMLASEDNNTGIPDDETRVFGNTVDVVYDEASFPCDHGTSSRSPALWYVVRGTGESMKADTCSNYTDFDTVISILEGPCGVTNSSCIVSNDDSCGSLSSSVIWPTEPGVDYYIRVAGMGDELVGEFGLRVSTYKAAPNDACSGATELTTGIPVSASMEGATPGDSTDCFYDDSSAGIWYYVDGTGSAVNISTCDQAGKGAFSGRIQVFLGSESLSGLECMPFAFGNDCSSSSTAGVKFFAEDGERYSILFLGSWDEGSDDNKNFTITVTDFEPPKNDECEGAFRMDNSSLSIIGSTEDSLPEDTPCNQDSSSSGTAPSVWYTVQGTGRPMKVSTCSSELTMDTSLDVLSGSCDQLSCVASGTYNYDATCEETSFGSSRAIFETEVDTAYYVLVTGMHSLAVGDFVLTISDADVPWNDRDTNATAIIPNTGTIVGSTVDASGPVFRSSSNETSCAFNPNSPGLWYSLIGTGQGYVISTCSNETTFETAISVSYGDCGRMECMMSAAYNDNSCSSGVLSASAVIWTEIGMEYLIFVHGANENTRGDFGLTVSLFDFAPNDLCSGALTVLPDNGTIFGSTFEATDSGTVGCFSGSNRDGKNATARGNNTETARGNNTETDDNTDYDYDFDYDYDYDKNGDTDDDMVNNRVFDNGNNNTNLTVSGMNRSPDLWYRVDGTGGLLTAFTNSENATFDTQIEILESENGTCKTLSCLVVNEDDSFGVGSQVEWFAELGMTYFVRVFGSSQSRGEFQLSVTTL